jgi:outer membrane receptor protein involved in Fe transport
MAAPAYAQTAETVPPPPSTEQKAKSHSDESADIVVTAQKTGTQSLQSVPLAIQAFSGDTLKERNINNVAELIAAVPGATLSQQQSVASQSYSIRGAGAGAANGDSPIGYYVDDVPFVVTNFGIAPPIRFVDLAQVEVLRGPQGTLYGQGSSGGVFIFHTRDPNLNKIQYAAQVETSKTANATGWNYDVSAAVSVPIIKDMLAVRVSGGHAFNPGWADYYIGPVTGKPDRRGVNNVRNDDIRVVALFKPADNVSVRAQYWHFRPRQDFIGSMQSINPPAYANTGGQIGFGNGDFTLYSVTANAGFKGFSVTSATTKLTGQFGIFRPVVPAGSFSSQFFPTMFSEELRIHSNGSSPLHWVLGGAYQDGTGPQSNLLTTPAAITNADNNTLTKNGAVFGEVSYDLFGGKVVPLGGLRYYHDKRSFVDSTTNAPTLKDILTWRANLSYLPTRNLTMFVTASTGFRPGIVQSKVQATLLQQTGLPGATQTNPERSTDYEIGVKWRSPDHRLSAGVNGYITKYRDILTPTPTIDPNVSGFSNFGDAITKGVDLDLRWKTPLPGLSVGGTANFNDSHYTRVNPIVQAALPYLKPGSRLVNTLAQNWRLDTNYSHDIKAGWEGFVNFAWDHTGDRPQSNNVTTLPYQYLTASLGIRKGDLEISVFGNNLSDARGPTLNLGTLNSGVGLTPRTVGLRLRLTHQ